MFELSYCFCTKERGGRGSGGRWTHREDENSEFKIKKAFCYKATSFTSCHCAGRILFFIFSNKSRFKPAHSKHPLPWLYYGMVRGDKDCMLQIIVLLDKSSRCQNKDMNGWSHLPLKDLCWRNKFMVLTIVQQSTQVWRSKRATDHHSSTTMLKHDDMLVFFYHIL